ncbi:hypothetical protein A1Q1_01036 [Trichosporon asahii var. asahii CBS 2479]|uniref:Uncharacterized protein n=1 Tax=Trichosporon asahii var. asahii (strain ATCC 90039 / CBS 2479 / JCM 2466 / KCTC 7840 / NBRC 103889/ NCYC 2677 / UAMH 7654) TaxID=1186058 RepID=J4UET0_TRIAS|nr:hypothetical protein A1Q1_01036 [Trichosporon asahii var. asahii CBS 2479]EJT49810.1 hypothetical protein A1Q1_01036 [Trichosporon asahii var. asahii CBS 2479]
MSPLHGYRTPWNEYPDWQGQYDFAVKVSPYSGPGRTHVERVGNGPLSRVVRYQGPPVGGVLSRLWRAIRPGPVFFTSFLYDDGGEHEVPRAALTNGFRQLVGDWHDLRRLALSVYVAWDLAPFQGPGGQRVPSRVEVAELEMAFYEDLLDTSKRYAKIAARLHWEAEFWGQYLAHLSDCEDAGRLPPPFSRFPGQIKNSVSERFRYRLRMWRDGRTIDDYIFRAAQGLYEREDTPELTDLKESLRDLRFKILEAKGYPEGGAKLDLLDPGRYRPPPARL